MDTCRYHGLDALRGIAMMFGLLIHACLFYLRPDWLTLILPWADGVAPDATTATGVLAIWIHMWRLPLFFLLAGFFVQMTIERRGARELLRDRLLRVFAVFVVAHLAHVALAGRPAGELAHLWFLWVLSVYCLLAPLTARWAPGWVFRRPDRVALLIVPITLLGLLNRNNVWHDIPNWIWELKPTGWLLYFCFFYLGQGLWTSRAVLQDWRRWAVILPALGCGTAATGVVSLIYYMSVPELLRQVCVAVATLGLVVGLIGLADRLIHRSMGWVHLLNTLSYPVYLFHYYIILSLSAVTIARGWPQHLAIPLVTLTGFVISVGCYLVLVRYTPLNWLLTGRIRPLPSPLSRISLR